MQDVVKCRSNTLMHSKILANQIIVFSCVFAFLYTALF